MKFGIKEEGMNGAQKSVDKHIQDVHKLSQWTRIYLIFVITNNICCQVYFYIDKLHKAWNSNNSHVDSGWTY
jgi:hypothetical protein